MDKKIRNRTLYVSVMYIMIICIIVFSYGLYMQLSFSHSRSVLSFKNFEANEANVGIQIKKDASDFKNQNQNVLPTLQKSELKIQNLNDIDLKLGKDISDTLNAQTMYVLYTNSNIVGYVNLDVYLKLLTSPDKQFLFVDTAGHILFSQKTISYTSIYGYVEEKTNFDTSKILERKLLEKTIGSLEKQIGQGYLSYQYITDNFYMIGLDDYPYQSHIYQPFYAGLIAFSITVLAVLIVFDFVVIKPGFKNKINEDSFLTANQHVMVLVLDSLGKVIKYNSKFYQSFGKHYIYKTIFDYTKETFDLKEQKTITIKLSEQHIPYHFMVLSINSGYVLISDHDKKDLETHYQKLALYNTTTNLPNHLALEEDLMNRVSSNKSGLIMIDIKDYRKIAKTIGYPKSQKLLNKIKEHMLFYSNGYAMKLYNFNHDVFVVWLDKIEGVSTLQNWAKGFLEQSSEPLLIDDEYVKIELKMGIFKLSVGKKIEKSTDVIEGLMGALDRAKNSSIYHYVVYDDEMKEYISKHHMMERDLKKAVVNDEFMIYLQPQYDYLNKKTIGFEALLRWNHPLYIKESPLTYIEIAERNSMIIDIGKIIMKKVFATSMFPEFRNYKFSFNVSPYQMLQHGFINDVLNFAKIYDIDYKRIAIEVTETTLAQSLDIMIKKIDQLKNYGFEVHLDDFGTGYSSLSYLKSLPLDVVKIDKKFIDHMTNDRADQILVAGMIDLVKNLGLGLIIEGVETVEQAELLSKFKAYTLQGYLISQPLPVEQAKKFIKKK